MKVYSSDPLPNPGRAAQPGFVRADLVFYGVDHSGPSFEARIFLNHPGADLRTPRDDASRYAGSFTVFGHGGCAGDAGHCEVPTGPKDPFDRRPPHQLVPQIKTVIITHALGLIPDEQLTVTVVPVRPGAQGAELVDALQFDRLSLLTYT